MVFEVPSSSEILYFNYPNGLNRRKKMSEYEEDFPGTQFFYFETGDQGALWNVIQVILKNKRHLLLSGIS